MLEFLKLAHNVGRVGGGAPETNFADRMPFLAASHGGLFCGCAFGGSSLATCYLSVLFKVGSKIGFALSFGVPLKPTNNVGTPSKKKTSHPLEEGLLLKLSPGER